LRLLPVLIVTAALVLSVRVGDLWQGVSVMAQTTPAQTTPPQPAPAQPGARPPTAPTQTAGATGGEGTGTGGADAGATNVFKLPPDLLLMTDEEVDLLQALAKRRQELDERARLIEEREVLLQAAERRVDEKVNGLKALKQTIEDLLAQQKEKTESQYQSLVKIYENMKPKDAARIFEELEMAVLLPVVERMKERKVAPVLAKMDPAKAKAITTELAQRRALPTEAK